MSRSCGVEAGDIADVTEVDGVGTGAGVDFRRATHGAHDEAGCTVESDGADAGGVEDRAEVDVELAGDRHLHDVERRGIGDATTGDLLGLDAELLLERGRLRATTVDDRDLRATVDQRAQIRGERRPLRPSRRPRHRS